MARKRKAHSRKPATSVAGRNRAHQPIVPAKKKASGAGTSSSHVHLFALILWCGATLPVCCRYCY